MSAQPEEQPEIRIIPDERVPPSVALVVSGDSAEVLVWGDCGMDIVPRESDHGYLHMHRVPAELVVATGDDGGEITYRPGCER